MNNPDINPIDSILTVKASGVEIIQDLLLEEGKSIAQLLYEQENQNSDGAK